VRVRASGAANLPIEALENACPSERYALCDGSGGKGRIKGGEGVIRDYRILADDIHVEPLVGPPGPSSTGICRRWRRTLRPFLLNPGT
jgi:N-methylhydantoinase B